MESAGWTVRVPLAEAVAAGPELGAAVALWVAVTVRASAAVPAFAGAVPVIAPADAARLVTSAGLATAVHVPAAAMVSEMAKENPAPDRTAAEATVATAGSTVTLTLEVVVTPDGLVAVIVTG
jgi:hypothetical protein